jgi:ankyrin repeat protein
MLVFTVPAAGGATGSGARPPLLSAVLKHDIVKVRELLRRGVSPDIRSDVDGLSALNYAAANNDLAIVKLLVAYHAAVNIRGPGGETPLMYAAGGRAQPVLITFLLAQGAQVNSVAKDGSTALLFAAENSGRPDVVDLLLRRGAAVDASNRDGDRPITLAAKNKKKPIVEALLAHGADASYAIVWEAHKGDIAAVRLLLDAGVSANARFTGTFGPDAGSTALMLAAKTGNLPLAQELLRRGADPNLVMPGGGNMTTALMWAAYKCDPDMIGLLKNGGATDAVRANGSNAYDLARTGWTRTMQPCDSDVLSLLSAMQ